MRANRSSSVMRPPLPVPVTSSGLMSRSSISRRSAGEEAGSASFSTSCDEVSMAGACGDAAASTIDPITVPTATVVPSATAIESTPATSAFRSSVILSVSISQSGSSLATAAPLLLNHLASSASRVSCRNLSSRSATSGCLMERIEQARYAAFFAPSTATVATGMPGGI